MTAHDRTALPEVTVVLDPYWEYQRRESGSVPLAASARPLGRGHARVMLWRRHPNRPDRVLPHPGPVGIPIYVQLLILRDAARQCRGLSERGLAGEAFVQSDRSR